MVQVHLLKDNSKTVKLLDSLYPHVTTNLRLRDAKKIMNVVTNLFKIFPGDDMEVCLGTGMYFSYYCTLEKKIRLGDHNCKCINCNYVQDPVSKKLESHFLMVDTKLIKNGVELPARHISTPYNSHSNVEKRLVF